MYLAIGSNIECARAGTANEEKLQRKMHANNYWDIEEKIIDEVKVFTY